MKRFSLILALLGAAVLPAEEEQARPARDMDLIQGTWSVVSALEDGKKIPREQTAGVRFVITAGTISIGKEGQDSMVLNYTLDPGKSPKAIDTTHELDPGEPIVQPGIYLLKGDILRLAIAGAGKGRPDNFDAGTGSSFVLKRSSEPERKEDRIENK